MPGRWAIVIAVVVACWAEARPFGQEPTLAEVLKRTAAYVDGFRRQLSEIVAEETYRQEITSVGRLGNPLEVNPIRTLKSDLLLVKPSDANRHVELRDVFEVDGMPVRDRKARLEALLRDPRAGARIGAIIDESARYNIGHVTRNINTPLMALQFLDAANQGRFTFKHLDKPKPVFGDARDKSVNDTLVFRTSTEMWTVEYRERGRGTIIKRPNGGDLPARGRFWIDAASGSVLISEMIVDGGGVIATVTVSYQSEPLMGFLVPVEMRETYVGSGPPQTGTVNSGETRVSPLRQDQRITGHAIYGKFRPLQQP